MIITKVKPLDEILSFIQPYKNILVLGCDGCTQPPRSIKEAEIYAELIKLAGKLRNHNYNCKTATVAKQCDNYILKQNLTPYLSGIDAILSMACGIGPQTIVEIFTDVIVFPAQNTLFMGSENKEEAAFFERCQACGECRLAKTGGICPVSQCSKGLLNGPCGGSKNGKCEIDPQQDCAWIIIYNRLKLMNKLDLLYEYYPPRGYGKIIKPRYLKE